MVLCLFALVVNCGTTAATEEEEEETPTGTFTLTSDDITNAGTIAATFAYTTCSGANTSPVLSWSNVPTSTGGSLAITVTDDDASDFVHWIVYNIPTTTTTLAQGVTIATPMVESHNDYGTSGYGGPCPPTGENHTYTFKIWAMNESDITTLTGFDADNPSTIYSLISDSDNNFGSASFTGTFTGT